MIHFTRSRRPEIVLFGQDIRLAPAKLLYNGKTFILKGTSEGQVRVSRFVPGEDIEPKTCDTNVADVIAAVVELGGGYAEVLDILTSAKAKNYLDARLVIDALPKPGRNYLAPDAEADGQAVDASLVPEMFSDGYRETEPAYKARLSDQASFDEDYSENDPPQQSVFAKMGEILTGR